MCHPAPHSILFALGALTLIGPAVLHAAPLQQGSNGTEVEVTLPGPSGNPDFRMLEWSKDGVNWEQVARDYGGSWESVFPHALAVSPGEEDQLLTDPGDAPQRFFRMGSQAADTLSNEHAVSRFLQQATFGPTRAMIAAFPGVAEPNGFNVAPYPYFQEWITAEMAKPLTSLRAHWRERSDPSFVAGSDPFEVAHNPGIGQQYSYFIGSVANKTPGDEITRWHSKEAAWHHAAMTADDALRQRAAWALSQTFVLSTPGMSQTDIGEGWLKYYDIFIRHAFGNFRDVLDEVTYSPMMGFYLTYQGNVKANATKGTFPDENYAREIMQLFTIGLWLLNQDGTLVVDAEGNPVPSYDNDDIFEFAKIFTGLRVALTRTNIEIRGTSNRVDPMRVQTSWHDFSQKTLLDYDGPEGPLSAPSIGPYPNGSEAEVREEIGAFLDHLHNHPNVPPFIARNLIQRMTVSNPSPNYIGAVAAAFAEGNYDGVGSNVRGDLSAVFRAILLHPEAREVGLSGDRSHGRLREPLIRLLSYARAFEITPDPDPAQNPYGIVAFKNIQDETAQAPFASPSVFNFYLPEFQPNGGLLERDLNAPEFQIHNDVTALTLPNAIRELVYSGIDGTLGDGDLEADLDLSHEIVLADDSSAGHNALLDHLELMLAPGRVSAANRAILLTAIDSISGDGDTSRRNRVRLALHLFALLPEFNVLQ